MTRHHQPNRGNALTETVNVSSEPPRARSPSLPRAPSIDPALWPTRGSSLLCGRGVRRGGTNDRDRIWPNLIWPIFLTEFGQTAFGQFFSGGVVGGRGRVGWWAGVGGWVVWWCGGLVGGVVGWSEMNHNPSSTVHSASCHPRSISFFFFASVAPKPPGLHNQRTPNAHI